MRYVFLLTILFITGCKKKDDIAPRIEYQSPLALTGFQYQDQLLVKATISDNNKLAYADVRLVDLSGSTPVTVHSGKVFYPDNNTFSLSYGFQLDNVHMASGNYYIRIETSDGENTSSEYLEINYQGAALEFLKLYFAEASAGTYYLKSIDDLGNVMNEYTIGTELGGISANSYHGQILVSGTHNESLRGVDVNSASVSWEMEPVNNPPYDYFIHSGILPTNNYYVGTSTGTKYLKSKSGATLLTLPAYPGGSFPEEFVYYNDQLVVDERLVTTGNHKLVRYYNTGVVAGSHNFAYDPVSMFYNSSVIHVFANDGSSAKIVEYNPSTGLIYVPHNVTGTINEVVRVSADRYALATSAGIRIYNPANNSLVTIDPFVGHDIVYETISQTLYVIGDTEIRRYGLTGMLMGSYPVSNGKEIEILYNK